MFGNGCRLSGLDPQGSFTLSEQPLERLLHDCNHCSLIVPLSWPSEPSGQNLKSNLLTATWWLGQYTNSLADAEQFGHLLGVVVAGWHEWQNAQRELCFNSSLWRVQNYFSQLRWKVSKMSQLYPAKINFFNVQSQNRPLFCFSVLVPETNTVVACLKIKFLFRSWLQKTVNSKCLIKNILCAKLLTLKQTITWSQDVYPE